MQPMFSFGLIVVITFKIAYAHKSPRVYSPIECARECMEGEEPRLCYYKFTLEQYSVLGLACKYCTPTSENQFLANCECVSGDGIERIILTANRMVPGPSIQVCKHDKIVVDVKNDIPGMEVTIHWHGVKQNGTQYYDGVPMVTQCPIPEGTSFRYQWIATDEGTKFWHSHAGLQMMDGLYGSLVIREPKSIDIHGQLYDYDLSTHVILISDWFHHLAEDRYPGLILNDPGQMATNLLINGKGIYVNPKENNETNTPLEVFEVLPGKRYRFRLINSMSSVCTSILTVEGHKLTLIATDGEPIEPVKVGSIISLSGERYDFVLHVNQKKKSYWIHVRGLEECNETEAQQFAILQYKGSNQMSLSQRPSYKNPLHQGIVANIYNGECDSTKNNGICISELNSAKKVEKQLFSWEKPDMQIYMPFKIFDFQPNKLFWPKNPYEPFLMASDGLPYGTVVNNFTYAPASSPLISQYNDIDPKKICHLNSRPDRCVGNRCKCTNIIDVPLHTLVELILVDEVGQPMLDHPFHLHGYSFNVLSIGRGHDINATKISSEHVKKADAEGRIVRKFNNPPYKDTLTVPENGYVVLRFRANNPGWWMFHCHFEMHMVLGMATVFHVGQQADLPPIPPGFPTCGNFKPPVYFV